MTGRQRETPYSYAADNPTDSVDPTGLMDTTGSIDGGRCDEACVAGKKTPTVEDKCNAFGPGIFGCNSIAVPEPSINQLFAIVVIVPTPAGPTVGTTNLAAKGTPPTPRPVVA